IIYHFGEYSRVSTSFDDYELVWEYNVVGTRSVIEFCKQNKSKLIYSASSTKFGDDGKNKDCSPYAFHKSQNTELINNYGEWFGLDYVICYFYNVYGAGQISVGKYATVVGIFERQYLAKEPQSIVFPGTQTRNFTHIEDVVSALVLLKGPSSGDGYCIGTDKSHMIVEVAKMFSEDVVIPTAVCEGLVLVLQQDGGKSNIETLIDQVSADKTPEASHPDPPFNIEVLTIKDITVIASGNFTVVNTKPVTAKIDEIVLKNVGTDGDAEVATEAITAAITHAILQHLEQHPAEGFSRIAFSKVTGIINKLPVFKQLGIGTALQDVTNGLGKGVDSILGGVGNLFGGGKDKDNKK
ncbi:MAG: NAD-dependent epimerase/dehydratase family protein, partial [Phycisphaerae bacterium]|nr:NAD-dependent epimerase/dehydratase family protein [Phycisphaerae bacterium]